MLVSVEHALETCLWFTPDMVSFGNVLTFFTNLTGKVLTIGAVDHFKLKII